MLSTSTPTTPYKKAEGALASNGRKIEQIPPITPETLSRGIPPTNSRLRAPFEIDLLRQQQDGADTDKAWLLNEMEGLVKEMIEKLNIRRSENGIWPANFGGSAW